MVCNGLTPWLAPSPPKRDKNVEMEQSRQVLWSVVAQRIPSLNPVSQFSPVSVNSANLKLCAVCLHFQRYLMRSQCVHKSP